jgi:hypothetical protein
MGFQSTEWHMEFQPTMIVSLPLALGIPGQATHIWLMYI